VNPASAAMPIAADSDTDGSAIHSLNRIAPYSLSSTATQKTGSEKNRNAVKVIA